jgi:hypothetical protein
MALIGAAAALFGWDVPQPAHKIAVLGAAFPLLFSATVNGLSSKKGGSEDLSGGHRSVADYIAGRY